MHAQVLAAGKEGVDGVGGLCRVPRKPDLRAFRPDRWQEQLKRARANVLRLFDPRAPESFERFDTVGGMVLHPLEDHHAIPVAAADFLTLHFKQMFDPERANLGLDERLRGKLEGALYFADTDKPERRIADHRFNRTLRKEMRLAGGSTARRALISGRRQQGFCPSRRRNGKLKQCGAHGARRPANGQNAGAGPG